MFLNVMRALLGGLHHVEHVALGKEQGLANEWLTGLGHLDRDCSASTILSGTDNHLGRF